MFLLLAILGLGIWAASYIVPTIWQDYENWAFDSELRREPVSTGKYVVARSYSLAGVIGLPVARGPARHTESSPSPSFPDNGIVGRLSIPRLSMKAMVREGASERTLSVALGHIPGTAFPGQAGSVGVAGHRDRLFRGLKEIRESDLIQLETPDKNYFYEVASTQIVRPKDVGVLKPAQTGDSELTLVTCYPFQYIGAAPYRFIVKARQVASVVSSGGFEAGPPTQVAFKPSLEDSPHKNGVTRFIIAEEHSRQLAPGISLGVTKIDKAGGSFHGWMWLMPDRRTVWLREQSTQEPVFFSRAGKGQELVITKVSGDSISGFLRAAAE